MGGPYLLQLTAEVSPAGPRTEDGQLLPGELLHIAICCEYVDAPSRTVRDAETLDLGPRGASCPQNSLSDYSVRTDMHADPQPGKPSKGEARPHEQPCADRTDQERERQPAQEDDGGPAPHHSGWSHHKVVVVLTRVSHGLSLSERLVTEAPIRSIATAGA